MAASKKTQTPLDLEGLFAKRKDKEKLYMPLKLKAADLKKIPLTKPTDSELETALPPYLGNNLMLAYKGKILCLAVKMPKEDWERLIGEEKTVMLKQILEHYKAKEKKSYVLLKLKTSELKEFSIEKTKPAPSASALEKAITPFLDSRLILLKKQPMKKTGKETLFLAYNLPHEEFVKEALQTQNPKKPFTLDKIATDVPINKAEFVELCNRMLETGRLQVRIDDKFKIVRAQFTTEYTPPAPSLDSLPGQNDVVVFRKAFDKLDGGCFYVRICNMRRELGWSKERFNALLRKLRAEGTIQLHAGDGSTMTEEDVHLSYTDENHFFYATMTWVQR